MRFRRLSQKELEALRDDFVKFLASNSIDAGDWKKMQDGDTEKADKLIDLFSDVVWEKVLSKAQYLEHRTESELKVFHCGTQKLALVAMSAAGVPNIDFTDPDCLKRLAQNPPDGLKLYFKHKDYTMQREEELFALVEGGAKVTDNKLFLALTGMYAKQKKGESDA